MNDEFRSIESELSQATPARLTLQQRQRMQSKIASQLSEKECVTSISHWYQWLSWCGAAAVIILVCLTTMNPRHVPLSGGIQLASSNVWEVQERYMNTPDSSGIRANQFLQSASYSNLPQAMLHKI